MKNSKLWQHVFNMYLEKGAGPEKAAGHACDAVALKERARIRGYAGLADASVLQVPTVQEARTKATEAVLEWLAVQIEGRDDMAARVVDALDGLAEGIHRGDRAP